MLIYVAFTFILKLSAVKSDKDFEMMCENDYKHMNNTPIDVSTFCSSNTCIEKCCGEGEMFLPSSSCSNTKEMFRRFKKGSKLISDVDYSKIVLWNEGVTKQSKKDFIFVKNQRDLSTCTYEHLNTNNFFILEDGAVRMQDADDPKSWVIIKSLEYCIDFKLTVINRRPQVILVVKEDVRNSPLVLGRPLWINVLLVGMLVSSFFLVVVLVVYCVLPELQNLTGLVLIAYTLSTLATSLANIVLMLTNESLTTKLCQIITPMTYFTAVSSVFWMNVMSFDVWWLLRGHRKRCDLNRRSERLKFMWYCLYAWGIPLLMTAMFTTLDYIDLSSLPIYKPHFDDCFIDMKSQFYYDIPTGLIISVNIILFSLTVYKIWKTKRAVKKISQDSRSSAQDTNSFATYMKLSLVMGVSLFLDLIPMNSLWLYILTTTYNRFNGIILFFLFVFNKRIFFMLCNRFNVKM